MLHELRHSRILIFELRCPLFDKIYDPIDLYVDSIALRSDFADAQTHLQPPCPHMYEYAFSLVVSRMILKVTITTYNYLYTVMG